MDCRRLACWLIPAAWLLSSVNAWAQEGTITGVVVDVEDQEGKPMANVPVFVSSNGVIRQIGQTSSEGSTGELPLPGQTADHLQVVAEECAETGQRRIVVRIDDKRSDDDCTELAAAFFPTSRKTHVRVRVSSGGATIHTSSEASTTTANGDRPPRLGIELEGGLAYAQFAKFGDAVSDQSGLASYRADESYVTPLVGIRLRYGRHLSTGLRVTLGKLGYRQYYEPNGGSRPDFVDGEVTGYFADWYAGYRLPVGPAVLELSAGPTYALNKAELAANWGNGLESTSRSESGWKFNYAAAIEHGLGRRVSLRVQYSRITVFKNQDADEQNLIAVLLVLPFVSRPEPF